MALGNEDGLAPVFDLLEAGLLFPVLNLSPREQGAHGQLRLLGDDGRHRRRLDVFSPPHDRRPRARRRLRPARPVADRRCAPGCRGRRWSPTAWSCCCAWACCGSRSRPRRCGGRSRAASSSATRSGSSRTRCSTARRPTGSPTCPTWASSLAGLAEQVGVAARGRRRGARRRAAGRVGAGAVPGPGVAVRRPVPPARLDAARRLEVGRGDGRQPVPVGLPAGAAAAGAAARGRLGARRGRRGLAAARITRTGRSENLRPSRQKPWVGHVPAGRLSTRCGSCRRRRRATATASACRRPAAGCSASASSRPPPPAFPRTLLVQPNLEMLAYRQGLTPALVAQADALRRLEDARGRLHAAARAGDGLPRPGERRDVRLDLS